MPLQQFRTEGLIFCPRCFCKREFAPAYRAAPNDPYPPIECVVCDYEFHKTPIEDPETGVVKLVDTLSRELRDQARDASMEDMSMMVAHSGYNLRPTDKKILNKAED